MKLLKETTEWSVPTPNHTYIFGSSSMKIIGYIKEGTTKAERLKVPMAFDRRGRSFTEVKKHAFDLDAFNG